MQISQPTKPSGLSTFPRQRAHATSDVLRIPLTTGLSCDPLRPYGYPIRLTFPRQACANTDWFALNSLALEPFSLTFFSVRKSEPVRYLTADEQKIFHQALWRSVRVIHDPEPAA